MNIGLKLLLILSLLTPIQAAADPLADEARSCLDALQSGDLNAADVAAASIRDWKLVFSTEARALGSQCLTEYLGETWTYSDQQGRFISPAELQQETEEVATIKAARLQEQERQTALAAKEAAAKAEAATQALMADIDNRERVASAVYEACVDLLDDDRVSALTNALCVDSFLKNGLPKP